ncbi:hypothetical protein FQR65_LT20691 [Abscondita terminalis]|nr:hypothetical protein FQR65_LT20691 [Abscondita terminalis]
MADISAASGEQSAGVSQVSEAVVQLDQTTQQNAALVEQMAAAAQSLRQQADELARPPARATARSCTPAGIYYPKGSLKARLCVQSRQMLYAYCAEHGVAYRRCGKLILATDEGQRASLRSIAGRVLVNGAGDLRWPEGGEAMAMEPALRSDLENASGMGVCHAEVWEATVVAEGLWPRTADGTEFAVETVVNAASLQAPGLASRMAGPGVHLTLDLGGQANFGPDVQWFSGCRTLGTCRSIPPAAPASMPRLGTAGLHCLTEGWCLAMRASSPRSANRRTCGGFLNPGDADPRRGRAGPAVRYRMARVGQQPGHRRAGGESFAAVSGAGIV